MTKEDFLRIAGEYIGEISEDEEFIRIENKNRIVNYYASGSVCADKVVNCKIRFRKETGGLCGDEATCSILGGFSCPPPISEDFLEKELTRYGFKKKQKPKYEQVSFFD